MFHDGNLQSPAAVSAFFDNDHATDSSVSSLAIFG